MAVRRRAATWRDGQEQGRRPVLVGDGDKDVNSDGDGDEDGDGDKEDRVHGPVPLQARIAVGQGQPWAGTAVSGTTRGATTAGAENGGGQDPGRVWPRA